MSKTPKISGEAHAALGRYIRDWSGWSTSRLVLGEPDSRVSRIASTDHNTRTFTINAEALMLNPNKVLTTVTPFRLRQEAVMTGVMLHEAAHVRFSQWQPRNNEGLANLRLGNGQPVSEATLKLAKVLEEPRIERRMAMLGKSNGLDWTMRAAAIHLLPLTQVSDDPAQAILDLLTSYILRVGRTRYLDSFPAWVNKFITLVTETLDQHFTALGNTDPLGDALLVRELIDDAIDEKGDRSTGVLDRADEILRTLFPNTDPGDMPQAGGAGGCSEDEQAEAGDQGESGEDAGQGSGVSGNPAGQDEQDGDEQDGEGSGQGESGEGDEQSEQPSAVALAQVAKDLGDIEVSAADQTEQAAEAKSDEAPDPTTVIHGAGDAAGGSFGRGWRAPTAAERDRAAQAERFLRDLIDPSESSKTSLSEAPSATVDGGALAAWKAGGQVRDPRFFLRTRRNVEPVPPVKIAILVDVSSSMNALQKPSALLSWALANAALDLRNFAGRGAQVESTLIHWGSSVQVIQSPGKTLPGIREVPCDQGTSAMHHAIEEIENQIPGFIDGDPDGKPSNRLLVQFTDWGLFGTCVNATSPLMGRMLGSGVNMLSVVPSAYSPRYSALDTVLKGHPVLRGRSSVIRYDPSKPDQVWDEASKVLGR